MAIKDLAEIVKKFTQKDKFKPSAAQVIRTAKNRPHPRRTRTFLHRLRVSAYIF